MMIAAQTSIVGADVICALVVLVVAIALEKVAPAAWIAWFTLFCAALLTFTLLFDL